MNIRKALSLISALLLATFCLKAQQTVLFKVAYLPNHSYTMVNQTDMHMSMNFAGPQQEIAKMRAKGIKLPMVMSMNSKMGMLMSTGSPGQDNIFPIKLKYTDIALKQTIAGKETSINDSPLIGQEIYAHSTSDGKFLVDSVPGKALNESMKSMIAGVINQMLQQFQMPDKEMKIGESFEQDMPFSIPISSMKMDMTIKIIYKLTAVKDNIGLFDINQSVNYSFSQPSQKEVLKGKATGAGTGKMEYYIDQNMIKNMNSNLAINYTFNAGKMTMIGKANAISDVSFTVN